MLNYLKLYKHVTSCHCTSNYSIYIYIYMYIYLTPEVAIRIPNLLLSPREEPCGGRSSPELLEELGRGWLRSFWPSEVCRFCRFFESKRSQKLEKQVEKNGKPPPKSWFRSSSWSSPDFLAKESTANHQTPGAASCLLRMTWPASRC